MQHKCRITVLRKECYEDLQAKYLSLIHILSKLMPFDESVWREAIAETVPKKFLEVNLRAFELGRSAHGE